MRFVRFLLLGWFAVLALSAMAQAPPAKAPPLSAAQQERLKERDLLRAEGEKLGLAGKLEESVALLEKALAIDDAVLGESFTGNVGWVAYLASLHERREDFDAAARWREREVALRQRLHGAGHWRVTDARLARAQVDLVRKLTPKQRRQLQTAQDLANRAAALEKDRKVAEAVAPAQESLDLLQALLGDRSPRHANALNQLANLYRLQKEFEKAEPLYRRALDARRELLGEKHPSFAVSLNNLGLLYTDTKDYAKAEPLLRRAAETNRQTVGERTVALAINLENLARLLREQGKAEEADALARQARQVRHDAAQDVPASAARLKERDRWFQEANRLRDAGKLDEAVEAAAKMLAIERQVFGKTDPDVANSMAYLAELHERREDFAAAKQWRGQEIAQKRLLFGSGDWRVKDAELASDQVTLLNRLTVEQRQQVYQGRQWIIQGESLGQEEKFKEAIPFVEKGSGLLRALLGERNPEYATSLNKLAVLYWKQRSYEKAEPLYRQALEVRKQALGERHPDYAQSLNNLAWLYQAEGEYGKAEPLHRQALLIRKEALGAKQPEVTQSTNALAAVYELRAEAAKKRGDFTEATAARKELIELYRIQYGTDDWRTGDARWDLADLEQWAGRDAGQRQALTEAAQLHLAVETLSDQGKYAEALPLARKALEIRREVLGKDHLYVAQSLTSLANLHRARREFAEAEPLHREALDLYKKNQGADHPNVAQVLVYLARSYLEQTDFAKAESLHRQALEIRKKALGESHVDVAASLNDLAVVHHNRKEYARAESLYRQALDIHKMVPGEGQASLAMILNNPANLYYDRRDYTRAEPLYQQALDVRKRVLGEGHLDVAITLNAQGNLYFDRREYAKAEPLYRQALDIFKKVHGEVHGDVAVTLNNLATLYYQQGNYALAEPFLRQALEVRKKMPGPNELDMAALLHDQANLYRDQGDYARAEFLYHQSLQLWKKVQGENHPDVLNSLDHLATLYQVQGDYARAEPLHRLTMEIRKKVLGENHIEFAYSVNNLANVYREQGKYAEAEPLYGQALEVRKKAVGGEHPNVAQSLHDLANLYRDQGEFARAEPLYRQALGIRKQALGEKHLDVAQNLHDLARMVLGQGKYAEAAALSRQAVDISLANLDTAAGALAERQQLAMTRSLQAHLHQLLSCVIRGGLPAEAAYSDVLAWKGAVFLRQRRQHALRELLAADKDPELAKLFTDLESTSRRLGRMASTVPRSKQQLPWKKQLADLTEAKERLEIELGRRSAGFRQQKQQARVSVKQLQGCLPAGVALVDVLEYMEVAPSSRGQGKINREQRLIAFVLRADQPLRMVELGPADRITAAVEAWRRSIRMSAVVKRQDSPGGALRRLVWEPLAGELKEVSTVLFSPDGALTGLSLGALPGTAPGSYLIEDIGIAVIPTPQMLPELLAPGDAAERTADPPSLLLVGDVDFGADPGRPGPGGVGFASTRSGEDGEVHSWKALPGTRREMLAIHGAFAKAHGEGRVTVLRGTEATETAVRRQAVRHRWLHLATHGFFAPARLRSPLAPPRKEGDDEFTVGLLDRVGVAGFHPGLLSGVALAGANQPVAGDRDDGILTALEVAELDLRQVDLAVLSACETGLGKTAGGEGVLGLQRAFQVAGARTTVTSLWSVPDEATRLLMERFYANLWDKGKPRSRLEALREAQLWMLREGRTQPGIMRGAEREDEVPGVDAGSRLPPYWWAAFVLSGDWR